MKVITLPITSTAKVLATIATIDGNKVKFNNTNNNVTFRELGDCAKLRSIRVDWNVNTMYNFTEPTLTSEEKDYLVAAMLVLGLQSIMVGSVLAGISETAVVQQARCATDYDKAQKYGISQHARQRQYQYQQPTAEQRSTQLRLDREQVKVELMTVGAICIAAVGIGLVSALMSRD